MADAPQRYEAPEMVEYLRATLADIDRAISDLQARRNGVARRLAALEAAADPAVLAAAADYDERLSTNTPYEDAEDAAALLDDARRRFAE